MKNTNGTYVRMKKKLIQIQKWIWQKEPMTKSEDPTAKLLKRWLQEIQEILDDEKAEDED